MRILFLLFLSVSGGSWDKKLRDEFEGALNKGNTFALSYLLEPIKETDPNDLLTALQEEPSISNARKKIPSSNKLHRLFSGLKSCKTETIARIKEIAGDEFPINAHILCFFIKMVHEQIKKKGDIRGIQKSMLNQSESLLYVVLREQLEELEFLESCPLLEQSIAIKSKLNEFKQLNMDDEDLFCKFIRIKNDLKTLFESKLEDYFQDNYRKEGEQIKQIALLENTPPKLATMVDIKKKFEVINALKSCATYLKEDKAPLFDELLANLQKLLEEKLEPFKTDVDREIELISRATIYLNPIAIEFNDDIQKLVQKKTELLKAFGHEEQNNQLDRIILNQKMEYETLFNYYCSSALDESTQDPLSTQEILFSCIKSFQKRNIFTREELQEMRIKTITSFKNQFADFFDALEPESSAAQTYSDYMRELNSIKQLIEVYKFMLSDNILYDTAKRRTHLEKHQALIIDPQASFAEVAEKLATAHQKPLDESLHGLQIKYTGPSSSNHQKLTLQPTEFSETKVSTSNGDGRIDASVLVPCRNVFIASMLLDLLVCNPDEYRDKITIACRVLSNGRYMMVEWLHQKLAGRTMDQKLRLMNKIINALGGINKDLTAAKLIWHKRKELEQGPEFSKLRPCDTFRNVLDSDNGIYYGFIMPESMYQNANTENLQNLHILCKKTATLDVILADYMRGKTVEDGYLLSAVLPETTLRDILKGFTFILGSDEYDGSYEHSKAKEWLRTVSIIIIDQHTKLIIWREGNKVVCITGSTNFSFAGLGLDEKGRLENVCAFTQTFRNKAEAEKFMAELLAFPSWILEQKKS